MDKQQQREVDIFKVGKDGITKEETIAIQATWDGSANSGQMRIAMNVIIDKFSMADHLSFKEGSPDGSAFLAGRALVGKLIRTTLRKNVGELQ